MSRNPLLLVLLWLVIAVAMPVAQERPNFSGTWKNDHASATVRGRGNSPGTDSLRFGPSARTLVISQDDSSLTVEEDYVAFGRTTVIHPLDGRTVTNQVVIERGATAPGEFTSQWKRAQLVSTFTVAVPGESTPRRYEQTMSLSPDGSLSVTVHAIGAPHARTLIYRK